MGIRILLHVTPTSPLPGLDHQVFDAFMLKLAAVDKYNCYCMRFVFVLTPNCLSRKW